MNSFLENKTEFFNNTKAFWLFILVLFFSFYFLQTYFASDIMGFMDGLSCALLSISILLAATIIGPRFTAITSMIIILINISLVVGSHFYYDLYQSFVPYSILSLASESVSLVSSFHYIYTILGISIPIIITLALWYFIPQLKHPSNKIRGLVLLLLFSTSLSLQAYHDTRSYKHFSPFQEAPLGYFMRSGDLIPFIDGNPLNKRMSNVFALATAINKGIASKLPDKYINAVNEFYPDTHSEYNLYPLLKSQPSNSSNEWPPRDKKNIIVIVLESFRASEMGLYGNKSSATPFLDNLGKKSIWAKKFYSTAPLTVYSETAINCGVLDYLGERPLAERNTDLNATCIPEILSKQGYDTFWFHGNNKSYYNRTTYLPKLGFQNTYAIEDLYGESVQRNFILNLTKGTKDKPILGWGIPDDVLYDKVLKRLENSKKPFYAEILSVSNHIPFDWDWGINFPDHLQIQDSFYDKYRRGMYYTDQAIKGFIEKFKQSKLYDDTVILITGDHGVWTFKENENLSDLNKHEQFFRMPLLVYGKNITAQTIQAPASHVDLPPTILSILNLSTDTAFLGRSLIDAEEQLVPIYTLLNSSYGIRLGDKVCIPRNRCFRNGSGCDNWEHEMMKKANISCYQDTGEPMFNSKLISTSISNETLSHFDNLLDYNMLGLKIGFTHKSKSLTSM